MFIFIIARAATNIVYMKTLRQPNESRRRRRCHCRPRRARTARCIREKSQADTRTHTAQYTVKCAHVSARAHFVHMNVGMCVCSTRSSSSSYLKTNSLRRARCLGCGIHSRRNAPREMTKRHYALGLRTCSRTLMCTVYVVHYVQRFAVALCALLNARTRRVSGGFVCAFELECARVLGAHRGDGSRMSAAWKARTCLTEL